MDKKRFLKPVRATIYSGLVVLCTAPYSALSAEPYTATLRCALYGNSVALMACMEDSVLKLSRGGRTQIYQPYNIYDAGHLRGNTLYMELPESFSVTAHPTPRSA